MLDESSQSTADCSKFATFFLYYFCPLFQLLKYPKLLREYYWIFSHRLEIPVVKILESIPRNLSSMLNIGFLRYVPFLNKEDCAIDLGFISRAVGKLLGCDMTAYPVRSHLFCMPFCFFCKDKHISTENCKWNKRSTKTPLKNKLMSDVTSFNLILSISESRPSNESGFRVDICIYGKIFWPHFQIRI